MLVPGAAVGAVGTPVSAGEATLALAASAAVSALPAMAPVTNAVVAILVVLSPGAGVGASGAPVNDGLEINA